MTSLPGGNAILALASAILWGGGDFSGGVAVKAAAGTIRSAFRVVLLSHSISLSILLLLSFLWGGGPPSGTTWAWGLLAGLFAALSLTTFYVALSGGAMGPAAALSGLLAAAIPAMVSIAIEGSPGPLRLVGFAIAGLAIWLVAAAPEAPSQSPATWTTWTTDSEPPSAEVDGRTPTPASRRDMILALGAGVGFGLYFVSMKMAGRGGLLWPMATVRIGSTLTCLPLVLATLRQRRKADSSGAEHTTSPSAEPRPASYLPRKAILWAMGPALLDTGANLLFMAATRMGRLDVASVLASLYPASTILLAAWMFHERPTRRQALGMLTAVAAVLMITL